MELSFATINNVPIGGRKALAPLRQATEGEVEKAWFGRDGALVQLPWRMALVLEGRVFGATVGTLSTGIVGGGNGTVLDLDQPEFIISVPSGTAIMPLRVAIQGNAADAVADHSVLEALICADRTQAWAADGTCTSTTIYNYRTDSPRASACLARTAFSADTTDPVHSIDLARAEVKIDLPANGETPIILDLNWVPEQPPVLVGPAMLVGYWGGTSAVTGYAQIIWAEFFKSEVT